MKLTQEQLRALSATLSREVFEPLRIKEKEEHQKKQQKNRELTKEELILLKEYKSLAKKVNEIYKRQYILVYPTTRIHNIGNIIVESGAESSIKNLLKINPSNSFKSEIPGVQQILDDLIVGTIDAKDTTDLINTVKKKYKIK